MHEMTETKPSNLTTWATDINHHHKQACLRAGEAINHAIEAGKLLIAVKQRLPHGEFGGWLEKNIQVTARQAQRYMAAAQGKPVTARAIASNTTPMSVLAEPSPPEKDDPEELDRLHETIVHLQYAVRMSNVRLLPVEDRAAAYESIEHCKQLEFDVQQVSNARNILMNENADMRRFINRQRRDLDKMTGRKTA
jgi:hypothetical protein